MQGYIYVLSNESMPGILKIGRSTRGGKNRATELYRNNTGVATPFTLVFEIFGEDIEEQEIEVHESLSHHRVNDKREFFKCSEQVAIMMVIDVICGERWRIYTADEFDCLDSSTPAWLAHETGIHPCHFKHVIDYMTPEEYAELYSRMMARRAINKARRA